MRVVTSNTGTVEKRIMHAHIMVPRACSTILPLQAMRAYKSITRRYASPSTPSKGIRKFKTDTVVK